MLLSLLLAGHPFLVISEQKKKADHHLKKEMSDKRQASFSECPYLGAFSSECAVVAFLRIPLAAGRCESLI